MLLVFLGEDVMSLCGAPLCIRIPLHRGRGALPLANSWVPCTHYVASESGVASYSKGDTSISLDADLI